MEPTWTLAGIAGQMKAMQDESKQIAPLTSQYEGFDRAAGYAVAQIIHQARMGEGAVPLGRKIGFTNPAMWPVYGVNEPMWGYVYDTTVTRVTDGRAVCHVGRFPEPKIEPEIVLHFRTAPPTTDDPAEILACIDWIAHGFEIVQTHFPGWKLKGPDSVADSALHAALLVGEPQDVGKLGADIKTTLEQFTVTLSCNGEVRETGKGANVLGSPLAATAHLLGVLATQEPAWRLKADELVTTGSLTQALAIRPGETWSTAFGGIALPGLTLEIVE